MGTRRKWPNSRIHAIYGQCLLPCSENGRGFGSEMHHHFIKARTRSGLYSCPRRTSSGEVSRAVRISMVAERDRFSPLCPSNFLSFLCLCAGRPAHHLQQPSGFPGSGLHPFAPSNRENIGMAHASHALISPTNWADISKVRAPGNHRPRHYSQARMDWFLVGASDTLDGPINKGGS
jgi:hypothetical protein